ncbi:hypothetical protein ABGB12_32925 [Actinocorallia sp. B10E7]|uniref:hypothetical protein n=1 Tax=Actinocorallia sp. B10E7 TaxID=3153558 RepID=UPI00325ED31F
MLVAMIVGAEAAFWVVLALGLLARYGLHMPRLGGALLLAVPLIDLVLLTVTFLDLREGGKAGFAHGLAAVYLGVSVAYGHQIIKGIDAWTAYRFAGGPRPVKRRKGGLEHLRHEASQVGRHVIAWATGSGLLLLGIWYVGDAERTESLFHLVRLWTLILVIDAAVMLYDVLAFLKGGGPKTAKEAEGAPELTEAARRR